MLRTALPKSVCSLWGMNLLFCLAASLTSVASAKTLHARDDATFNWTALTPSTSLNWTSCYDTFKCARLSVPLRYSDPTGEQAAVAFISLPSNLSTSDENYKGPILFNPGGPGDSGVGLVLEIGTSLRDIVGPQFDIVGFDPRGVGFTTPGLSVFTDSVEAGAFLIQYEQDVNATETSIGRAFAQKTLLGKLAVERVQDVAKTMTTPTVVRDMLSFMNAVGQEKLQYWGFSYGTVIGATFAAMFPDKVGRLVIDGVENSETYYQGNFTGNLVDIDKPFTAILDACVAAGPEQCPLYENSTDLVRSRVNKLLDKLRVEPVPLFNSTAIRSAVVDYATVKEQIFLAQYSPYTLGADLTFALAALEQGDGSLIYSRSLPSAFHSLLEDECSVQTGEPFVLGSVETTIAIGCGDQLSDDAGSIDNVRKAYAENAAVNSDFAGVWTATTSCPGWTIRGDDRFNGSFVQNTSHPILLVANTGDPVTPLENAQKMSEGFKGSVVLTIDGNGHSSRAVTSPCAFQAIQEYFVNGTLPEPGTVCQIEDTIFGTSDISSNASTPQRRTLDEDDSYCC